MEIHQLRYFCAVAVHGTFTRAAQVEGVAQPSLSQQIIKLEAELGARLFDRMPKHPQLTPFGAAFLPKARQILRELGEVKTEIQEMAGKDRGNLTIGVIPTIAPYWFPAVLAGFMQRHKSVVIRVVEDTTRILLDRLEEGSLDLAIVALPVRRENLVTTELFRETLVAVLPEQHPRARTRAVSLKDLRNEPFLLLKEGHCFRDSAIAACRNSKVKPNVVFESGQFASILALVSAGVGISLVPEMAVQQVAGCVYVPVENRATERRIGVVRIRQHFETRAQHIFLRHIKRMSKNG